MLEGETRTHSGELSELNGAPPTFLSPNPSGHSQGMAKHCMGGNTGL